MKFKVFLMIVVVCILTTSTIAMAYNYDYAINGDIGCNWHRINNNKLNCIYHGMPTISFYQTMGEIDNDNMFFEELERYQNEYNNFKIVGYNINTITKYVDKFLLRINPYNDILFLVAHGNGTHISVGEDFATDDANGCENRKKSLIVDHDQRLRNIAGYLECYSVPVRQGANGGYHDALALDITEVFHKGHSEEAQLFTWTNKSGINTAILYSCDSKKFTEEVIRPRIGTYGKIIYAPGHLSVNDLLSPHSMTWAWMNFFATLDGSYVEGIWDRRDFLCALEHYGLAQSDELLEYTTLFGGAEDVDYFFGPDTQLVYAELENDETGEMCYWDYNTSKENYKSTEFCNFSYESSSFNAYFEFTDLVESDWRFYLDGLEDYKVEKTIIGDTLSLKYTDVIYEEPVSAFGVFINGIYYGSFYHIKYLDSDGDKVSDGGPKLVFNVHMESPQNNPEEIVDNLDDLQLAESVFFRNPVDEANNLPAVEIKQDYNPIHSIQAQTDDEIRCVEGYCEIDARCIRHGEEKPNTPCLVCDITKSITDWTMRPNGTACEDELWCTAGNTCRDGVCGVYRECDDGIWCNGDEFCAEYLQSCHSFPRCPNDAFFCNGVESCDEENHKCLRTGDPCSDGLECDEENDTCVEPHPDDDTGDDDNGDDDTGDDDITTPESPIISNARMDPGHVVMDYYYTTYSWLANLKWDVCDPDNDLMGGKIDLLMYNNGIRRPTPPNGIMWEKLNNPNVNNAGDCQHPVEVQYNIFFCRVGDERKYIQGHDYCFALRVSDKNNNRSKLLDHICVTFDTNATDDDIVDDDTTDDDMVDDDTLDDDTTDDDAVDDDAVDDDTTGDDDDDDCGSGCAGTDLYRKLLNR